MNKVRFAELTCERSDAVRTNWPTVLANLSTALSVYVYITNTSSYPARKALKGKLVTSTQYTNWMTPERIRNTRKASMNFSRGGVESR